MSDITEVIRCRRIEVVDADGVVRLLLHCDQSGEDSAYLEVFTPKQSGSLVLFADEDGVGVQAWDRGNTAAQGHVGLDGTVTASVRARDGGRLWEFDSGAVG